MGDDAAVFGFYEQFWGGTDNLEGAAVDVEEVRGGVHGAEMSVDVERVEGGGAREALRGHSLDNVA